MFVAKFKQVDSPKFKADKNGNNPYIGEILSGTATGSIINGTMFIRDGLEENKQYLCQNVIEEYEGTEQVQTQVISLVSLVELKPLMDQLGPGRLVRAEVEAPE